MICEGHVNSAAVNLSFSWHHNHLLCNHNSCHSVYSTKALHHNSSLCVDFYSQQKLKLLSIMDPYMPTMHTVEVISSKLKFAQC